MASIKISNLKVSTSLLTSIKDEDELMASISGAVTRALDVRGGTGIGFPGKPITLGIIYQPDFPVRY